MLIKELCKKYDDVHEHYRKAASAEASIESMKEMHEAREKIEDEVRFATHKVGSWSNQHPLEVLAYFNTWFIMRKGWA